MHYPFLFQFKVRPAAAHKDSGSVAAALATVMVFAESGALGRCRSVRYITDHHWEIDEFLRALILCPHQVGNFDAALSKVYRQAELFGISACFDGWAKHPH